MEIKKGEVSIGGKVEIITAQLELAEYSINKNKFYRANLRFNLKISCEIDGIEIKPFYTDRIFELSPFAFADLKEKGIITS